MPRAVKIILATDREPGPSADTLILNFTQRTTQRGFVFGVNGSCVELDFSEPVRLHTDDALLLDDGAIVEIVAEAEPLLEVRAADPSDLARLAWHFGDRHTPIELKTNRLRVRREPATEAIFRALNATFVAIEAPFEPEGGAYSASSDHHHHDHAHAHDHHDHHHDRHDDHEHSHGHEHHHHKR